jgi:hypothetical protein
MSAMGDPRRAVEYHTDALRTAAQTGARDQQARAHAGLGRAHQALDDLPTATRRYEQAMHQYAMLGAPEVDEVRNRLATLGRPG